MPPSWARLSASGPGRRLRPGTRGGRPRTCAPSTGASSSPRPIDPRSPERGQCVFVQALIREVGYATLSKRDRRARHLSAARYVEGLGDDELAGVQALHYRDAYLAMPDGPEGEAVAVQARLALRGAAERASALHSNDLALTYLEQALSISPDSADDPELLERAGNAAFEAGRHDAAQTHLTRAIERYRDVGERAGLLRATAALGASYVSASQVDPAIAILRAATEEYPELEGQPAMVSVGAELARAYMIHEEPQVALEWAERTLAAAERLDMVTEVAEAMNTKALVLQILGRFIEATTVLRGVLWLAEQNGLTQAELRAYNNLSFLLVTADPRTGLEVAQVGIERGAKVGARVWVTLLASNGATAALRVGDWATAQGLIDTWLEASSDWVSRIELESVAAVMAACRAAPGDQPAPEFDSGAAGSSDPQIAALVRITRAWVGLCEGRDADSITDAMAGAEHRPATPSWPTPGDARGGLVRRRDASGRGDLGVRSPIDPRRGRRSDASRDEIRHGGTRGTAPGRGRPRCRGPRALVEPRSPLRICPRGDRCLRGRRSIAAVARAACRDGARDPRGARHAGAGRTLGSPGPDRAGARSR